MSFSLNAVGGHDHVLPIDISVKYFKRASFSSALSFWQKETKRETGGPVWGKWTVGSGHFCTAGGVDSKYE